MSLDPGKHRRRSIRLKGYDYSQAGAYFITICTLNRECLFGEVVNGGVQVNEVGRIVQQCWNEIPKHFPHIELDAFVVMPNHVHGILVIPVGARHAVPLQNAVPLPQFGKPVAGSIPTVVRSFKSAVTCAVNALRGTPGLTLWQRNYYEHIIRNEESLNRIREYIATNPLRWHLDQENPYRTGDDEMWNSLFLEATP